MGVKVCVHEWIADRRGVIYCVGCQSYIANSSKLRSSKWFPVALGLATVILSFFLSVAIALLMK